ncbi:hypothetical protein RHRU231_230004 [Rhodococcus ruber]|uniref:Uncharacterized protein n=1 Tax=Rhodococcus ruber TaxID=1830 RepID=A0A098BHI2_9NOCA|nr:hypothetical protein RHRU231_230004 [Rhodococcus ruber]
MHSSARRIAMRCWRSRREDACAAGPEIDAAAGYLQFPNQIIVGIQNAQAGAHAGLNGDPRAS